MLIEQALNLILDNSVVLGVEEVELASCWGRVGTGNNRARLPVPCYDQSNRDGYVIRGEGRPSRTGDMVFRVRGEIPAGPVGDLEILPGDAYRIMTGGLVPERADRVIPQELCRVDGGELRVGRNQLCTANRFIRRIGCVSGAGDRLVGDGTRLNETHAARFASSGNSRIEVYRRPRVAFLCSGSELVLAGDTLQRGQKFSSNHYLLTFLIERHGGIGVDYGVVADEPGAIEDTLRSIIASDANVIISTGGVGPGKYDLFSALLPGLGAHIHYRSLQVRPGRSTLFATIGDKLYFGLPGPPAAVHILFHECVCPALRKMQGLTSWFNRRLSGSLNHDISLKASDVLCFREGVCSVDDSGVTIQTADKRQAPNCFIMLEPGVGSYRRGDRVTVSLLNS